MKKKIQTKVKKKKNTSLKNYRIIFFRFLKISWTRNYSSSKSDRCYMRERLLIYGPDYIFKNIIVRIFLSIKGKKKKEHI